MGGFFANYKTSITGLLLVLVGLSQALLGVKIPGFGMEPGVAITIGLGLLSAKDGNVTGGTVPVTVEALSRTTATAATALGFAMLLLFSATDARAADMIPTAPVKAFAAPVAVGSWNGVYVGALGAVAKTKGQYDFLTLPGAGNVNPSGAMAGAVVGVGTWLGNLRAAAEVDASYDFSHDNKPCGAVESCKTKASWFMSQRVVIGATLDSMTGAAKRAGATPASQWPVPINVPSSLATATMLPYLTGGIAERRLTACVDGCQERWLVGWTAGGGMRIPVSQSVTFDTHYLYVRYNKSFTPGADVTIFPAVVTTESEHIIRGGLHAHF